MGSNDPPNSFTQTFLLDGETDLPMLRAVDSSEIEARKKRAHRKSRWGCMACKRRKVKVRPPPHLDNINSFALLNLLGESQHRAL